LFQKLNKIDRIEIIAKGVNFESQRLWRAWMTGDKADSFQRLKEEFATGKSSQFYVY